MYQDRVRQILNILFSLSQIAAAVVVTFEIGGPSVGAVSNKYPTYVVPAGYAFSIWSIIYALSLGYALYQFLPRRKNDELLRRTGWFSASAFLASTLWVFIFRESWFVPSVLVIVWLLLSLVGVVVQTLRYSIPLKRVETIFVRITFSIYLGWVCVATVANIAQTLVAESDISPAQSGALWAVIVLIVVAAVAAFVTIRTNTNLAYAAAVSWALTAIAVRQLTGGPATDVMVGITALVCAVLVPAALVISRFFSNPAYPRA